MAKQAVKFTSQLLTREEGSIIADISALGELRAIEPLDLENYQDNKESGASLPVKGRYTVQAPNTFPLGRTKAGALSAQVDPTIVGPTSEGYTLRFTKVSAKFFNRGGMKVSQFGDYLRACGIRNRLTNEAELIEAVEQTANRIYQIDVDWRAYHKDGFSVEGMERFPSDGNGGHIPWFEHPSEKDEAGNPLRLRANLTVDRYVPAEG